MAGAKLMYNDKVKASTIIEVIISMVIIVVVFGIAMMIYFGGFLAIPFMPLAGMPLAIHYNRHR